jgi:glutamine cyclotransferase
MNKVFFGCLIFSLLVLAACEDDTQDRRTVNRPGLQKFQPPIRIKADKKGTILYGDTVSLQISSIDTTLSISEVQLSCTDNPAFEMVSEDLKIALPTTQLGGGEQRVKVDVKFADGQKTTRYKEFKILSETLPRKWQFEVIRKYPHDPTSFTQGFLVHEGFIYEGTGNYGETKIRKLDLTSGKVLKEKELEQDIFGEGITIFNDKIYQLTYKSSKGFVYDLNSFERERDFIYNTYTSEGWGLTSNDSSLIASDGSAYIFFLNPADMSETRRIKVFNDRGEINNINELEYRDGIIYANIYTTAVIIGIDAETGRVVDEYVASGIVAPNEATSDMDVLNGIAFNPLNGNFLLTGKYWSKIYEARPIPRKAS